MCVKLDSEKVLISYFERSSETEISFKDLNTIRSQIEERKESVYVDVTYSSIRRTVTKYQNFMELNPIKILIDRERFDKESLNVELSQDFSDVIEDVIKSHSH